MRQGLHSGGSSGSLGQTGHSARERQGSAASQSDVTTPSSEKGGADSELDDKESSRQYNRKSLPSLTLHPTVTVARGARSSKSARSIMERYNPIAWYEELRHGEWQPPASTVLWEAGQRHWANGSDRIKTEGVSHRQWCRMLVQVGRAIDLSEPIKSALKGLYKRRAAVQAGSTWGDNFPISSFIRSPSCEVILSPKRQPVLPWNPGLRRQTSQSEETSDSETVVPEGFCRQGHAAGPGRSHTRSKDEAEEEAEMKADTLPGQETDNQSTDDSSRTTEGLRGAGTESILNASQG